MSTALLYDSGPVDAYIRELSLREKEITRSRGISNFKKEVPYKILLFLGYVVGICLLILCLFYGLKNLLIQSEIYQPVSSGTTINSSSYEPQSIYKDQLIDVESILEQQRNNPSTQSTVIEGIPSESPIKNERIENQSDTQGSINQSSEVDFPKSIDVSQETTLSESLTQIEKPSNIAVRDYVIFDTILFDGEYISEIIVGRQYENPNEEPNSSWCYSTLNYASGLNKTLYLVETENNVTTPTEINHEIANKFGVPISEINRAQRACVI